ASRVDAPVTARARWVLWGRAASEVLDALQHFGHERRPRADQRRAHGPGTNADRRVVRTEAARRERVVGELVAVALVLTAAAAGGLHVLGERRGAREDASCCDE